MAEEERPGAAHLELPEDIASEGTNVDIIPKSLARRPTAETKSINRAVEMIKQAKHPLVLIGAGANRKTTCKMLTLFIEKTGIPFFTTQMGKGVVDEHDPLFLGNAALSDFDFLHRAIDNADLLVNVGHDVVEKPPFFMKQDGFKVIHINFSSAIVDPVYFPQVEVIGDIANSVWQLNEGLQRQDSWDFSYFFKVKEHIESHLPASLFEHQPPTSGDTLENEYHLLLPANGIRYVPSL